MIAKRFAVIITVCMMALSACGKSSESSSASMSKEPTEPPAQVSSVANPRLESDDSIADPAYSTEEAVASFDYGSMDEPHDITAEDIPHLRRGEYVRITGPANIRCTGNGKIAVGGHDKGSWAHSGLELSIEYRTGHNYLIDAVSVDPGSFKDTFYTHPAADFSTKPRTVGDLKFSGCIATIVGRVDRLRYGEESDILLGFDFSEESVVEDLESRSCIHYKQIGRNTICQCLYSHTSILV